MRDINQRIRYLGFQCTPDGGRRLRFSVDESGQASATLMIKISASFFIGPERISFQEAAGICSRKLLRNLDAGTLQGSIHQLELSSDDVATYRELRSPRR